MCMFRMFIMVKHNNQYIKYTGLKRQRVMRYHFQKKKKIFLQFEPDEEKRPWDRL